MSRKNSYMQFYGFSFALLTVLPAIVREKRAVLLIFIIATTSLLNLNFNSLTRSPLSLYAFKKNSRIRFNFQYF